MNKEALVSTIASHQPQILPETEIESAVLLLILYDEKDNLSLVVTKRSENIAYPGDYCFPGGTRDIFEQNFNLTAMREVREELNIGEECYRMIAQLDDFQDRHGNRVRPFVAIIFKKIFEENLQISDEIVNVHLLPLDELLNFAESPELEQLTRRHPAYLYIQGDIRIWGLTASIMVHFANLVFKQNRPLGHEVGVVV